MIFQNPFAQPVFILIEWQIPMSRFLQLRFSTTDGTLRINQIHRAERSSTLLTLIAVCLLVATMRASTSDITVGQELLGFRIIVLLICFFNKLTFIVKLLEKVGCCFGMYLARSS